MSRQHHHLEVPNPWETNYLLELLLHMLHENFVLDIRTHSPLHMFNTSTSACIRVCVCVCV
jgi:hypothetical protein